MSFINTLDANNRIGTQYLPTSVITNPLNENLDLNGFDLENVATINADNAFININTGGGVPQIALFNSVAGGNATTWNIWNASAGAAGLNAPGSLEFWSEYGANNGCAFRMDREGTTFEFGNPDNDANNDPAIYIRGNPALSGRVYDNTFYKASTIVNNDYSETLPGDAITFNTPLNQAIIEAGENEFPFIPEISGYFLITGYIEVATASVLDATEFVGMRLFQGATELDGGEDMQPVAEITACPLFLGSYARRFQIVAHLQGSTQYTIKMLILGPGATVNSTFPVSGVSILSYGPLPQAPPAPAP